MVIAALPPLRMPSVRGSEIRVTNLASRARVI